jgi:CTP synthase
MPYLGASKEFKTKPAQNSVRDIRGLGIAPDVLAVRSEDPAPEAIKKKLSLFCGVSEQAIALLPNAKSIYEVPLTIEDGGVAEVIAERLGLDGAKPDLKEWRTMVEHARHDHGREVTVGVVAKYLDNQDTYMSVFEALRSAAWANNTNIRIEWIDAEKLETAPDPDAVLGAVDGLVVPGGFGSRGVEGKILAAGYALQKKVPYLGLCYGLHMAVIAAARLGGLEGANTTEANPDTAYPVINTMEGQDGKQNTGGTMRLGDYDCDLTAGSLAEKTYGAAKIVERHRHRYECAPQFVPQYEAWGIRAVGTNPGTGLVEVIEGVDHPYFIASQFHPEFKSRPTRPHPMFDGFIASLAAKK